ncbi:hypothetical protein PG995_004472 [Apiospora arundinis]
MPEATTDSRAAAREMQKPLASHYATLSSTYRSLDEERKEIRLFQLLPADDENAPIQGRLHHHSLSDKPVYNTVSYVWGDPSLTGEEIEVDGKLLRVTPNLHGLLRNLRSSQETNLLWIDAICINQKDLPERSHQVAMMRQIYEYCRADLVWLGPTADADASDGNDMEAALQLFERISGNDIRGLQDLGYSFMGLRHPSAEGDEVEEEKEPSWKITKEEKSILEHVLVRPAIWNRIWIVQELACAPKIILAAGKARLEWDQVAQFLGPLPAADAFHRHFGSHGRSTRKKYLILLEKIKRIHDQRTLTQKGERQELLDVLARWSGSSSTDPRDRIYGVIGLAPKKLGIPVDYSRTIQDVHVDTAQAIIDSSANLDIIAQDPWQHERVPVSASGSNQEQFVQLPSWVPSFSVPLEPADPRRSLLFAQRGIFNCGPSTCHVPCSITDDRALRTRGVVLDSVGKASPGQERVGYSRHEDTAYKWMRFCLGDTLLDESCPAYVSGEPAFTAYWRTLAADRTGFPMRRLQADEIGTLDSILRSRMKQRIARHSNAPEHETSSTESAGLGDVLRTLQSTRDKEPSDPSQQEGRYLFDGTICDSIWCYTHTNWCFNLSEKGLYAMLLRGCVQQSDTIACLEGAKVPLVLRRVARDESSLGDAPRFKVIGPAYVHGFMDMEAFESVELRGRLGLKTEEILLV